MFGFGQKDLNVQLFKAVRASDLSAVQTALSKGADVKCKNREGLTPFFVAVFQGNLEIAKVLFDKGSDINATGTSVGLVTPLILASFEGNLKLIEFLLDKGAKINERAADSRTALMMAVTNNQIEVVKLLLDKGADINAKATDIGWNVLFAAAWNGNAEITKLLLSKGVDANTKATDGKTALDVTKERGHTTIVQLIEQNAVT
jgi:ankyrin repeat protein